MGWRLLGLLVGCWLAAACFVEPVAEQPMLRGREASGTTLVDDGDHAYLQLRPCPQGQALVATGAGWECGVAAVPAVVNGLEAGPGVQITREGQVRRLALTFEGSGGLDGVATTAARSDHGHSRRQIAGLDARLAGLTFRTELETELARRETASHQHPQVEIAGLGGQLAAKATQAALEEALKQRANAQHGHAPDELLELPAAVTRGTQARLAVGVDWSVLNRPVPWSGRLEWRNVTGAPDVAALRTTLDGLVARVTELRGQVESLRTPPPSSRCPPGWTDQLDDGSICRRALDDGSYDEMVRMGDFLIDRYEASLWTGHALDLATGLVVPDQSCQWAPPGPNAGDCFGAAGGLGAGVTGIAVSVAQARVLHSVSWFQAQALCVNSGKRLCTNEEWQLAALGTPDAGGGNSAFCNINSELPAAATGAWIDEGWEVPPIRYRAGASPQCKSSLGVHDLVGNVWEWVAWWSPAGSDVVPWSDGRFSDHWPGGELCSDRVTNLDGSVWQGATLTGLPAAAARGGAHGLASNASGALALSLYVPPSYAHAKYGFRCCRGGR